MQKDNLSLIVSLLIIVVFLRFISKDKCFPLLFRLDSEAKAIFYYETNSRINPFLTYIHSAIVLMHLLSEQILILSSLVNIFFPFEMKTILDCEIFKIGYTRWTRNANA